MLKSRHPASVLLVVAAVAVAFCARADNAADTPGSLDVGGVTRTYVAHVPAQLGAGVPLVLSFHGHFSTGAQQSHLTGMDALSDARGFIVVYPDGIRRSWNDGRAQDAGSDDIALVKALIADLSRRYPIDPKRIYVTGFSNGAIFSQYVGCLLSGTIAAIAPVSGYLPPEDVAGCRPSRPISVLEIGGTTDPVVPYTGGQIKIGTIDRGQVLSAERTIAFWKDNAKCGSSPQVTAVPTTSPADGTSIVRTVFQHCRDEAGIELDTVVDGGHTWPGGPQYLPPSLIGVASNQLEASRAIVDFFYAHRLR